MKLTRITDIPPMATLVMLDLSMGERSYPPRHEPAVGRGNVWHRALCQKSRVATPGTARRFALLQLSALGDSRLKPAQLEPHQVARSDF